jgi:hypothetical protein
MDRYAVSNAQNGRLLVLLLNTLNGAYFPETVRDFSRNQSGTITRTGAAGS